MAVLVEKSKQRQLKCVNLKTHKISTHYFDTQYEVNPSDQQVPEFFDVALEDNYSFGEHQVRYRLTTPVTTPRTLLYNMATKRT